MRTPIKLGLLLFSALLPCGLVRADDSALFAGRASDFKPHWVFDLGLTSSGTPGDRGGGQNANDLSFTATDEFNESGAFLSLEGMGGSQKVEGVAAKYGSLSIGGGLGLGFFTPSLSLSAQTGDSALFSISAGLNLGFQIFDDISLGVNLTGALSSHQVPLSALIPLPGVPDTLFELDSKSWGGGLSFIWATSEIFSLSLSGLATHEITYQIQNLSHTAKTAVVNAKGENPGSVIPSSALGFSWAFVKDFSLNGSVQRSEEFEPAGISYSPSLGETVFNETDTTVYFSGYSIGLTYSFQ